jgi:hypothetical protein
MLQKTLWVIKELSLQPAHKREFQKLARNEEMSK